MSPLPNYHTEFLTFLHSFLPLFLPRALRPQAASSHENTHMQAGQCGHQMGTKFWEVVCDKHGIDGDGEYLSDHESRLGRMNLFYHEAPSGNCRVC